MILTSPQGELMHRLPKRWYKRTAKTNPRRGVLKYERKVARIRELRKKLSRRGPALGEELEEQVAAARRPDIHHYIGHSQKVSVSLFTFAPMSEPSGSSPDRMSIYDPLAEV